MITKERLAEIERLANDAAPGPWKPGTKSDGSRCVVAWTPGFGVGAILEYGRPDDIRFVSEARVAVPELLAYVGELEALRDASRKFMARRKELDAACETKVSEESFKAAMSANDDAMGDLFALLDAQKDGDR